jgi:hypothetical protein
MKAMLERIFVIQITYFYTFLIISSHIINMTLKYNRFLH